MGIDITLLRVDKRKWDKEKLKSEEERYKGCLPFLNETEIYNGYSSIYRSMIEVIEEFYSHKGKQLKYEKYPLLEGWQERDLKLDSIDFYHLIIEFRNKIILLKESLVNQGIFNYTNLKETAEEDYSLDSEIKNKLIGRQKHKKYIKGKNKLLDLDEDIREWINVIESPSYKHEDYEYVITIH